jgi:hypothetical protein
MMMMEPLSQRTPDDCAVCSVAMVMGAPSSYERVSLDATRFPKVDDRGYALAWWKDYLEQEGFEVAHELLEDPRRFSDLSVLPDGSRALLVYQIPHMGIGHIVAIDNVGVIDPMDQPARYVSVAEFNEIFRIEGWRLYSPHYWVVRKRNVS